MYIEPEIKYVNAVLKVRIDENKLRSIDISGDKAVSELVFEEMAWLDDSGIYTDEVNIEF